MARHRRFRHIQSRHPIQKPPPSAFFLLDQFSVEDIKKYAAFEDQILKFHWDYYNDLAYRRSKIVVEIKKSLLEAAQKNFEFPKWQRAVKIKYELEPLSVAGSLKDPAGGRFNIGDLNPSQFPPFPALYLAIDKDTAIPELLSQKRDPHQKLTPLELALTDPSSIAIFSLSGSLDSIINLKERTEKFRPFVDLIKNFDIPNALKETAQKIGLPEPNLIRTIPQLIDCLLAPNWREWPMQFDVPSPSQIFGHLAAEAGIEGILYPSKFTGKDCLAIFPQNFDDSSDSFVQLDGELPPGIKISRLDAKIWSEIEN